MNKSLFFFGLLILLSSFVSALFDNPFSILDASPLGNITLNIDIMNKEDMFCLQNGNCTIQDLTVLGAINNATITNYDVTGIWLNNSNQVYINSSYPQNLNLTGNVTFRGHNVAGYEQYTFKILETISGRELFKAQTQTGAFDDETTKVTIGGSDSSAKFKVQDEDGNRAFSVSTDSAGGYNRARIFVGDTSQGVLSFDWDAGYSGTSITPTDTADNLPYVNFIGNSVKGQSGLGYADYAMLFFAEYAQTNGLSLFSDDYNDDYRMEFFEWTTGNPTRPLKICNAGQGLFFSNCTKNKDTITIYPDASQHWYSNTHVSKSNALFTLNGTYYNPTYSSVPYGMLIDTGTGFSITSAFGCGAGSSITNCLDANQKHIIDVGNMDIEGNTNLGNSDADTINFNAKANTDLDMNGNSLLNAKHINSTGNFTGNQIYGEMWYHNHTGTTTAFADSVWQPMFFTNATELNGFSYVGGFSLSSNLTSQVAGLYKASYRLSGSGQNNHIYISTILINGTEQEKCEDHKQIATGGDIIPMGNSCFIRLDVGYDVTVAVQDFGGSGNGDYYSGNLNLVRIGD